MANTDGGRPRRMLRSVLMSLGLDSVLLLSRGAEPDIKARLRPLTIDAQARGISGAPSFALDGELFWGDDRLEAGLA